jgi:hypothetical protein
MEGQADDQVRDRAGGRLHIRLRADKSGSLILEPDEAGQRFMAWIAASAEPVPRVTISSNLRWADYAERIERRQGEPIVFTGTDRWSRKVTERIYRNFPDVRVTHSRAENRYTALVNASKAGAVITYKRPGRS